MEPSNQPAAAPTKKNRKRGPTLRGLKPTTIIILLLILVLTALGWLYWDTKKENDRLSDPQVVAREEADRLKAQVGQLVELPDEQPTVATVSDVSKLQGQQFFAKAQNGDKVLIFTNARRAVLYRPSTNKVIEFAPVNIGDNAPAAAPAPAPAPTPPTSR